MRQSSATSGQAATTSVNALSCAHMRDNLRASSRRLIALSVMMSAETSLVMSLSRLRTSNQVDGPRAALPGVRPAVS